MVSIENEKLLVDISKNGAELFSIKSKMSGREFLWQGNPKIWSGRSPLLFPIVGRVKDDKIITDKGIFTMYKHGFASESVFEEIQVSQNEASFILKSSKETKKCFPYDFELILTYRLKKFGICVFYEVKNTGDDCMYFSIGAHPGFNCQMGDVLEFENKETKEIYVMNADAYIYKSKPFLSNQQSFEITEDIFKEDALMFEHTKSKSVTLKSKDGTYAVSVNYGNAPFLGIWAKPKAPYVCIEPWFGINDFIEGKTDFSEKYGIQSLKTGERFNYLMEINFYESI